MVANALAEGEPIIYCNERFCQMVGFSRAEIMQKPAVSEFLHGPLTSAESINQVREVLSSSEEKQIDILYYKKDGKWQVKLVVINLLFSSRSLAPPFRFGLVVGFSLTHLFVVVVFRPIRDRLRLVGHNHIALLAGL